MQQVGRGRAQHAATIAALSMLAASALAQRAPGPAAAASGIYSCVDDRGRRLTADRPIPECNAKEQRVLNSDGSLRSVHPPTLTAEERAEVEARERRAAEMRAQQVENVRRDRNLLQRFKNEDAHRRAREAALDTVRAAMRVTEARVAELARERKPLLEEAEFYKGKTLPAKLRTQLDANDAAGEAQRAAAQTQAQELDRISRLYDAELDRLRRLWAGAQPGSMGPILVKPIAAAAAGVARP